jgi:hypothetical protein
MTRLDLGTFAIPHLLPLLKSGHYFNFAFEQCAALDNDATRPDITQQLSRCPNGCPLGRLYVASHDSLNIYLARSHVCDDFPVWPDHKSAVFDIELALHLAIEEYVVLAVQTALDAHSLSDDHRGFATGALLYRLGHYNAFLMNA